MLSLFFPSNYQFIGNGIRNSDSLGGQERALRRCVYRRTVFRINWCLVLLKTGAVCLCRPCYTDQWNKLKKKRKKQQKQMPNHKRHPHPVYRLTIWLYSVFGRPSSTRFPFHQPDPPIFDANFRTDFFSRFLFFRFSTGQKYAAKSLIDHPFFIKWMKYFNFIFDFLFFLSFILGCQLL